MYEYFDLISEQVMPLGLKDSPERIINLDEASFCHDPQKLKVIECKGKYECKGKGEYQNNCRFWKRQYNSFGRLLCKG